MFKKNLYEGAKLAKKIASDKNVMITFQGRKSLREAAMKKADAANIDLSKFLRACLREFIASPIEKQTNKIKREVVAAAMEETIASDNEEGASDNEI